MNHTRLDPVQLHNLLIDTDGPEHVNNMEYSDLVLPTIRAQFPDVNLKSYTEDARRLYLRSWRFVLLNAAIYYRTYKKFPTPAQLEEYLAPEPVPYTTNKGSGSGSSSNTVEYRRPPRTSWQFPVETISMYFGDSNFDKALNELGIQTPKSIGLSERQILTLSLLSSFSDTRTRQAKLSSIGVRTWEFDNWMAHPKFQEAFRRISEQLLNDVQPVVNSALVQLAVGTETKPPDLSAIKYLNEVNGRWNPQAQQVMDVRQFMTRVVDILTDELASQPDLLNRIGMRLSGSLRTLELETGMAVETGIVEGTGFEEVG